MAFPDRTAFSRKQKKISKADLGKIIGTSGDIIGKYRLVENKSSLEVVAKIANVLALTFWYLVKDGQYDDTPKRLKRVQELDLENRSQMFATTDALIKGAKLKSIAV